jgi:hypothetical protein
MEYKRHMFSHEAYDEGMMESWNQDKETGKVYCNSTNLKRTIRDMSLERECDARE